MFTKLNIKHGRETKLLIDVCISSNNYLLASVNLKKIMKKVKISNEWGWN